MQCSKQTGSMQLMTELQPKETWLGLAKNGMKMHLCLMQNESLSKTLNHKFLPVGVTLHRSKLIASSSLSHNVMDVFMFYGLITLTQSRCNVTLINRKVTAVLYSFHIVPLESTQSITNICIRFLYLFCKKSLIVIEQMQGYIMHWSLCS